MASPTTYSRQNPIFSNEYLNIVLFADSRM